MQCFVTTRTRERHRTTRVSMQGAGRRTLARAFLTLGPTPAALLHYFDIHNTRKEALCCHSSLRLRLR